MQEERHRDALERLSDRYRLGDVQDRVSYYQKIFLAQDRLAESYLGSGMAGNEQEAKRMADTYLAGKSGADMDSNSHPYKVASDDDKREVFELLNSRSKQPVDEGDERDALTKLSPVTLFEAIRLMRQRQAKQ